MDHYCCVYVHLCYDLDQRNDKKKEREDREREREREDRERERGEDREREKRERERERERGERESGELWIISTHVNVRVVDLEDVSMGVRRTE